MLEYVGNEAQMTNDIATLRTGLGWTQQQLATIVRVSRQTIIAIEKGNYEPSTSLSLRLALALGARVEELFALTPEAVEIVQSARQEAAPPRRSADLREEQAP